MKSKAYARWCAKWILMTFNNFKKTKNTLRTKKKKKIYSANLLKVMICSLRAHSCLSSSKIFFFQLKEIIVHTMYCFSLCKNKAFHSRHCGGLSGGVFVIFTDLEVCAGMSRFTENVYLSH